MYVTIPIAIEVISFIVGPYCSSWQCKGNNTDVLNQQVIVT